MGYCHSNLMCEFVITRVTHTVRVCVCCVCVFNVAKLSCIRVQCAFGAHLHWLQSASVNLTDKRQLTNVRTTTISSPLSCFS